MNFLIAMVTDTYLKVMKNMEARSYLVKLQLICDREQTMLAHFLENTHIFPNYIIMRRHFDPITRRN